VGKSEPPNLGEKLEGKSWNIEGHKRGWGFYPPFRESLGIPNLLAKLVGGIPGFQGDLKRVVKIPPLVQ